MHTGERDGERRASEGVPGHACTAMHTGERDGKRRASEIVSGHLSVSPVIVDLQRAVAHPPHMYRHAHSNCDTVTQGGVHTYSCNLYSCIKSWPAKLAHTPPPSSPPITPAPLGLALAALPLGKASIHTNVTAVRHKRSAPVARGGRCALMCTEDTTATAKAICEQHMLWRRSEPREGGRQRGAVKAAKGVVAEKRLGETGSRRQITQQRVVGESRGNGRSSCAATNGVVND